MYNDLETKTSDIFGLLWQIADAQLPVPRETHDALAIPDLDDHFSANQVHSSICARTVCEGWHGQIGEGENVPDQ
jgi:hypothetical protein